MIKYDFYGYSYCYLYIKSFLHRHAQLPPAGAHVCLYSDGTKVTEEFFRTLPDHTELVLLSRDQTWSGGGGDFFFFITKFQAQYKKTKLLVLFNCVLPISVVHDIGQLLSPGLHSHKLVEAAKGLLSDEQSHKGRKILCDLLLNLEDRSELESRKEDENWFKGKEFSGHSFCPH